MMTHAELAILFGFDDPGAMTAAPPFRYSKPFLEAVARTIREGHLSAERAAGLLGLQSADDLEKLFVLQKIERPRGA